MTAAAKPTVYEAWSHVMADVQKVGKTGHNKQQDYNFRGIDAVVNAAGPALREHGVIVMPSLLDVIYRDVEVGKNRTLMRETTVRVRYTIIGPGGDPLVVPDDPYFGVVPGESMDSGDKGTAKAMSVAYRIFLLQALTIPTSDPDPVESSYERAGRSPEPGASTKQQAEIHRLGVASTPSQWAEFVAWSTSENLPPQDRLTARQADRAIARLHEIVDPGDPPATPGDGSEPAPPGSGPDPEEPGAYTARQAEAERIAAEAPEVGS